LANVYRYVFDKEPFKQDFEFGHGALFIVSKKAILSRPKEFYLKIVQMLEYSIAPIEVWALERMHQFIFDP